MRLGGCAVCLDERTCGNLGMTRDFFLAFSLEVVGHQCAFGLWCSDADGLTLVKRPPGCMTKSKRIVATLDRKCSGNLRRCHMKSCAEPVPARSIERNPLRLVNAVLRGR